MSNAKRQNGAPVQSQVFKKGRAAKILKNPAGTRLERRRNTAGQKRGEDSRKIDIIVVLLCLLSALFFLGLFYLNLNQRVEKQNEKPIGTITFKYNSASRKFSDSAQWNSLQRESPIYDGDIIRTAELSDATITFENGGQVIDLSEASIIQIFAGDYGLRVELESGGIAASSSGGGIEIAAGGKTVAISGGSAVNAQSSEDGAFGLTVSSGSAALINEDGIVETAAAGNGIFLNAEGRASAEPRVIVSSPAPSAKIIAGDRGLAQVVFVWNTANWTDGMTTRIECAGDRAFKNILHSKEYDRETQALVPLPAGIVYWRVSPVEKGAMGQSVQGQAQNALQNTSQGKINVISGEAPRLLSPTPDEVITFRSAHPNVRYQWTGTEEPLHYRLTIADNRALSNPVIQTNVSGLSWMNDALGPGVWFWSVQPVYTNDISGAALPSSVSSFQIAQIQRGVPAPSLVSPGANGSINGAQDAAFTWKGDKEAASFTIALSRNRNLSSPVLTGTVTGTYYTYSPSKTGVLQSGDYYWAVLQTDAAGGTSPWSETRPLRVGTSAGAAPLPAPIVISPSEGSRVLLNDAPLQFQWRAVSGADYYRLRLYGEDKQTPEFEQTVQSLSVLAPVTQGGWTWTVQALAGTEDAPTRAGLVHESDFSARNSASITLFSPANGETVMSNSAALRAVWTESETLRNTRFVLSTNPRLASPVFEASNPSSPLSLPPSLPPGEYYWTVRGETDDGYAVSPDVPARFRFVRKMEPVTLAYPLNNAQIPLVNWSTQGYVRWARTDIPQETRLVVSKNQNPLSGTPIVDRQVSGTQAALPELEAGVYYWTIRASSADKQDMSAAVVYSFRVLPIPPLSDVRYTFPQNGAGLPPEDLRANRRVVFQWEAVEGANEYIFTLWKAGSAQTPLVRSALTEQRYVYDDLAVLAQGGDFVWRVAAQYRNDKGVIERISNSDETRFSLFIPRPERGEAHDPGILYGR